MACVIGRALVELKALIVVGVVQAAHVVVIVVLLGNEEDTGLRLWRWASAAAAKYRCAAAVLDRLWKLRAVVKDGGSRMSKTEEEERCWGAQDRESWTNSRAAEAAFAHREERIVWRSEEEGFEDVVVIGCVWRGDGMWVLIYSRNRNQCLAGRGREMIPLEYWYSGMN